MRTPQIRPFTRALVAVATATALATSLAATPAATAAEAATCSAEQQISSVQAANFVWNIRESYVNYITGPIARGSLTGEGDITVTGERKDTKIEYRATKAELDGSKLQLTVDGAIHALGHKQADSEDWILDTKLSNLRLTIDGANAALVADVASRPMEDTHTASPVEQRKAVTLVTWTMDRPTIDGEQFTINSTGAGALTEEGRFAFGNFYKAGDEMAPLAVAAVLHKTCPAPEQPEQPDTPETPEQPTNPSQPSNPEQPAATPQLAYSAPQLTADGTHVVTVTGTGFTKEVLASRPPLAGKNAGLYIAFGRFADEWKPSAGAGRDARPTADVKWAVHQEDMQLVGGAARGAVELTPAGTFTAQLQVSKEAADKLADSGNYGIYTYAGGGAVEPSWEMAIPLQFVDATPETPAQPEQPQNQPETSDNSGNTSADKQESSSNGYAAILGVLGLAGVGALLVWIISQTPFAAQILNNLPPLPGLPR
ncbi:HtaA domain-containing protein [Corynebacterium choanae]|uniref:Htaa n=1 Tax=Corynebacterium choanae TaxID=1862358 RepID=A0A3G6J4C9_9CORY|nr:HtaA domain-containing protein [Corynebacterium choanae]AZA12573.1 Htaa [Corynebacterium choanae]